MSEDEKTLCALRDMREMVSRPCGFAPRLGTPEELIDIMITLLSTANKSSRKVKKDIMKVSLPTPKQRRLYFREVVRYLRDRGVGLNAMKRIFNGHKSEIRTLLEEIDELGNN